MMIRRPFIKTYFMMNHHFNWLLFNDLYVRCNKSRLLYTTYSIPKFESKYITKVQNQTIFASYISNNICACGYQQLIYHINYFS